MYPILKEARRMQLVEGCRTIADHVLRTGKSERRGEADAQGLIAQG
jgi:hypothetical protein